MKTRLVFVLLTFCAGYALAQEAPFASRQAAMDYLAAALPQATAANPKFRTVSDGSVSQWLTKEVRFGRDASGAVTVEMHETYSQSKDGTTTPGTHAAGFSLADVEISPYVYPDDVTLDGAKAEGLMFACRKPGCIAAAWSGSPSRADKTDISLQDGAARAKIFAAFRYLQGAP